MARPKRKINPILPVPTPTEPVQRIYQVGGYIRLSVEDSGKPGTDTIATQRELIQSYISSQSDLRLYDLYCDNGRTGTNFNRPEFERMMNDVRSGKIDCIVVKDLSRFGRNYRETGDYLETIFPLLGVRFIAVNDHFDTLTAERTQDGYIVPLKNIINAVYSKDISRKIRPALLTKRQNGEFIGSWAAYGYQKCADDRHRIEPDEEAAQVVQDIFEWRLSGLSYHGIVRKLNECGIPSPAQYHYLKGDIKSERYAHTLWNTYVVKRILSNEVYLGHMIQGRKRSGFSEGKRPYYVPESEWMIVRNTHEPLIDEDTFRAVQQMTVATNSAYKENLGRHDGLGTIPNILRGLVYCADCKLTMTRYKNVTNKGKNLYYTYICRTHAKNPASCPKKNLHETELKKILWDVLQREIALTRNLDKLVQQYSRSSEAISQEASLNREIAAAKQAIDRATRLYDSLYQNYIDKLITEQEYMELKQKYRADMDHAKNRLEMLEQQQKKNRHQTTENPWLTACIQYQQETELTEAMAHALIERVEVDAQNRVSITLRYRDEYRTLLQLLEAAGEAVSI